MRLLCFGNDVATNLIKT